MYIKKKRKKKNKFTGYFSGSKTCFTITMYFGSVELKGRWRRVSKWLMKTVSLYQCHRVQFTCDWMNLHLFLEGNQQHIKGVQLKGFPFKCFFSLHFYNLVWSMFMERELKHKTCNRGKGEKGWGWAKKIVITIVILCMRHDWITK